MGKSKNWKYFNEVKRVDTWHRENPDSIDFNRKLDKNSDTMFFIKKFTKLDKNKVYTTVKNIADYLEVDERTIRNWESQGILFPYRINRVRTYEVKDILRAVTIKYLTEAYRIRRLEGVKLILKLTAETLVARDNRMKYNKGIDDINIDKFLMASLGYGIEMKWRKKNDSNVQTDTYSN